MVHDGKKGIHEKLCANIEGIYKKTKNRIRIKEKIIGEFYT